jgi:hypothetical protein
LTKCRRIWSGPTLTGKILKSAAVAAVKLGSTTEKAGDEKSAKEEDKIHQNPKN